MKALLTSIFRWAKKRPVGRPAQGDANLAVACNENRTSPKAALSTNSATRGLSPTINDPATIARREAKKRLLAEQAKQLLGGKS